MLILGNQLIGMPIMGLQTGTKLAVTKEPIIDPSNLKIVAYEVDGALLTQRPSFLRIADIREISPIGIIIDSHDEFIGADDVINIKKILDIGFKLIGMEVVDQSKHRLGKVESYNIEAGSFIIQQLNVKPGMIKSFNETELLINRSQIIEINNRHIIVRSAAKNLEPIIESQKLTYMNPFRSNSPQTDNSKTN